MHNEQPIERYLYRKIKERGGLCIKLTGLAGIPDRLVILPGRVVFVELKAEGGRLSPLQVAIQKKLAGLLQEVYTLWSYQDVDDFLRRTTGGETVVRIPEESNRTDTESEEDSLLPGHGTGQDGDSSHGSFDT